ncbi:glucan endo-1,3-beta-D-glucosidase-like [Euphorbia lathyris]|uniref:glucan endo-1,3-beta-D-glucosidase-like n=1 Tax=Euphorbia lathyris TaxID=212925 RepID=UPI003313652A
MANSILSLLFILAFLSSGKTGQGMVNPANGEMQEKTWCVAKPSASEAELAANINYVCEQIGICKIIEKGGSCYFPPTKINHASVVMNLYYQLMGRNYWNCDFRGTALRVTTNPSYRDCEYP